MRVNRLFYHGLIFLSFLALMIGLVSCDSGTGRYQGLMSTNSRGLVIVDTHTGEAKIVFASGISSNQLGKAFKDMDAFPEKKEQK